ncbi:hypothetical protein CONLIGDRAFT_572708 [Coniochaeta ligniaria NRRL 30616]|uniref:Uncharacterized protein n=1 Tax=Coniochaeta ligniaria NRRL 30616 TaxID=1408157 RepID=A0A1J7IWE3_9PEZI|nr:hypothetical protein CONLIGDRAFT_572708 [Coniochaeta ligniaria NRRL 30616]
MSLWPFRRKSRRRRPDDRRGRQSDPLPLPRSETAPDAALEAEMGHEEQRRQTTEANKLQRRARTYSFSPGRDDSIRAVRKKNTKARRNTKPPARSTTETYPSGRSDYNKEYGEKETDSDIFGRVPTLHNKRDGQHLMPRKKSSKRRKNDHDREAEIKAMSNFVPLRPATEEWLAGRPMKRDTRRVRTGLGLGFRGGSGHEWDKENRSSDISLPIADSIHSTMSSDSEHISFRVSALEALAPRPTLHYASYPRWGPASDTPGPIPARMPSQRRKFSERGPIPESTLKAHKRVDDLADDLDASDLRELMERDKRRRERKRQIEQEKLERRLARRAEKQRDEGATAEGESAPKNLERGVLGRDAVGLGLDPASTVITSTRRRPPDSIPKSSEMLPEGTSAAEEEKEPHAQPQHAFHRTTSIPLQTPISPVEPEKLVPSLSHSPKVRGLIRSKKSRSKSSFTLDEKTEASETLRKGSETSSSRGPMAWMSIFRWTNRARRDSEGPSSFSNTSRETMQTTQLPTPSVNYISQQKLAGVPKRTMSRFREDLPEITPLSPPISRVQSPDTDVIPPTIRETSPEIERRSGEAHASPTGNGNIYGAPDSPRASSEAMRETPSTFSRPDEANASPVGQNMSLASIDSEASWLSGRIGSRRRSSARSQPPHRVSSNNSPTADQDVTREEVSIDDDEYLSRFTSSGHGPAPLNRMSTGEARPSSDEGEEARWGSVKGQVPTVVQTHTAERMKSREGLLNSFGEEAESDNDEAPGGDNSPTEGPAEVQRATSINLGKSHVRNFSAGSAKLLNLTPRSSVDGKRRSAEPR